MPVHDRQEIERALPRLREDVKRSQALASRATERARRVAEEAIAMRRLLTAGKNGRAGGSSGAPPPK